ncbi:MULTISPECIES: hypothetical protein [Streptomyces]|uniref:Uncharacterized protein n=1 Tax=Streptomyces gougerotii TaxID=53448 RepID=A0A8H9LRQ0_9ACTN|nr:MULTISPECIES: hypothetical protein [Streptomyces]MBL3805050.1 hypothetical protein [Streptomyces sp. BRB081]NEC12316.1 hypothetical protein [Streptomyces sp. SID8014]PJM81940.1 hypothetical protein CH313_18405 [Streptomyces sp. TSRI0384-2]GFH78357.1 hypothetical protein Sgou_30270 [Streptomyces gougerotii]GGU70347.1 hypothetical protein GCM10010227_25490 [Streptomyces gougerotii]
MNTSHQSSPPSSPSLSQPPNSAWIPWLLVMVLFSALVAACVGFLKALDGTPVSGALLAAGAAFGGTALLCLAVVPVVQQLRQRG